MKLDSLTSLVIDCHNAQLVVHMMPDLPNVGWDRDMESFREFFENPDFRTDGLKLYPTLVIRGTGLYELWKKGLYRNYSPDKLVDLVAHVLALVTSEMPRLQCLPFHGILCVVSTTLIACFWQCCQVPPWVRVYRIQRDIPMPLVSSGVEKGNLRELALARMGRLGLQCRDVRTRECGIQDLHQKVCNGKRNMLAANCCTCAASLQHWCPSML